MNLYKKTQINIGEVDVTQLKGQIQNQYGQLTYYAINLDYLNSIVQSPICKIPPNSILLGEIIGAGHLQPHRDHNISCCINYYFQPNQSATFFYKENNNAVPRKIFGKTTANIYNFESVSQVGCFKAMKNESYLLNVSEIHSVWAPIDGIRQFITWQWVNTPYDIISENLITTI